MSTNYYSPVGGLGISYLGQKPSAKSGQLDMRSAFATPPPMTDAQLARMNSAFDSARTVWMVMSATSAVASGYHGYKRSRGSAGSAVGWGLLGAIFPIIVPVVALAQGFGKPKVTRNRRRRTSRRRT